MSIKWASYPLINLRNPVNHVAHGYLPRRICRSQRGWRRERHMATTCNCTTMPCAAYSLLCSFFPVRDWKGEVHQDLHVLEGTRTDSISHRYCSVAPAAIDVQRVSCFFLISARHPSINSLRTTVPSSHNHVATDNCATSANEDGTETRAPGKGSWKTVPIPWTAHVRPL